MTSQNNCRFCSIVKGEYSYIDIDQPFASNENYLAVASVGAFIEGWALIIPKEHKLSLKSHYKDLGFIEFANSIIYRLTHIYGPIIAFEHGANNVGSITSCGTDHAHFHLVPLKNSLIPEIDSSNLFWDRSFVSEIATKVGTSEYLFYIEPKLKKSLNDLKGYLHILKNPISQYFRHVIAKKIGRPEFSDYRQFPNLHTSQQTRRTVFESAL